MPRVIEAFSREKLIAARASLGWRREDLASASGLSFQSVVWYELGRQRPSFGSLALLADALGVERADLLDEDAA